MTIGKQIGKKIYRFEVEGNNFFEAVLKSSQLSFPDVNRCGLCQNENLYLHAYKTKEGNYEYVKICCASCGASITFGQRKDDKNTYFLRRNESGAFDWREKPKNENTKTNQEISSSNVEDWLNE